jgi:hypothetical protein
MHFLGDTLQIIIHTFWSCVFNYDIAYYSPPSGVVVHENHAYIY